MDKDRNSKGSITIELLIAFFILTTAVSAAVIVLWQNQTLVVDEQTSNEALYRAQTLLEEARAMSRDNFSSVTSIAPSTETSGPMSYTTKLDVVDIDTYTKQAQSTVSWTYGGRSFSTILKTILTDARSAAGGAVCSASMTPAEEDRWKNPQMKAWEFVKDLVPVWSPSNNFIIEGLAPARTQLFLVGGSLQGSNVGGYIIAFKTQTDPTQNPQYLTMYQIMSTVSHPSDDDLPQAVTVSGDYAYIANGRSFCTTLADCGQLIIVNISKVDTQALTSADVKYYKVPGVTANGTGKSIYYSKGVLYLGLTSTGGHGPEFVVLDVGGGGMGGTPTAPVKMGSYPVGYSVYSIYVSDHYAYLSTSDKSLGNALMVLDLNDLSAPKWTSIFGSSFGHASGIVASASSLYVGYMYNTTNPEMYILNNPAPATQKPSIVGPGVNVTNTNSVYSLINRGNLVFIVTGNDVAKTGDFEIYNVSDPSSPGSWATPLTFDGGGSGTAGGCKGKFIYVGSRPSSADKAHIAVFYPEGVDQTITFDALLDKTYGDADFDVSAAASSGLPVTFSSLTTGVCTVSGSTVHIVAKGTCTLQASQAGNYAFKAAPNVVQSFTVHKADTVTAVSCPASVTYTGAAQTPCTATVTGPGGLSQALPVAYGSNTNAGTATASASYAGSANYNASSDSATFTIDKAPSVTSITCPASVTYNGAARTPCAASVTGPGGLSLTPVSTYVNNTNVGVATASYSYGGDANHTGSSDLKTFTITKATPTITWANPAAITYGTPLGATQLNASTGVAGAFTYTPSAGTVLNAGAGQILSVHFVPTDTANYNTPADKTVTITVNKVTPSYTLVLKPSNTVTVGTPVHDEMQFAATGSGVLPTGNVTFTVYKNGTCGGGTLQTNTVGINGSGLASSPNRTTIASDKPKISYQAVYTGDGNYINVTGACQALTVN